jgi:alpha/beta superfamily hydrolase
MMDLSPPEFARSWRGFEHGIGELLDAAAALALAQSVDAKARSCRVTI